MQSARQPEQLAGHFVLAEHAKTMNDKYAEYLLSEPWKQRRIGALIRSGKRCEICGTRKRLEVHHLTYANIFNEPLSDLMVLCHSHHGIVEEGIRDGSLSRIGEPSTLRLKTLSLYCKKQESKKPRKLNGIRETAAHRRAKVAAEVDRVLSTYPFSVKSREQFKADMRKAVSKCDRSWFCSMAMAQYKQRSKKARSEKTLARSIVNGWRSEKMAAYVTKPVRKYHPQPPCPIVHK